MKVFILAIMICTGSLEYTCIPHQEEPRIEYKTFEECKTAAESKQKTMMQSAKKYPDLGIVSIQIKCESSEHLEDRSFT